jgi:hypothetical protein
MDPKTIFNTRANIWLRILCDGVVSFMFLADCDYSHVK